jgi:hypothetical protein
MPWMEFEPTIPASERAKTLRALDRAATVTGDGNGCEGKVLRTRLHVVVFSDI